ncbi:MAG TPA: hypothetical protein VE778_02225 [Candidatus Bathyarchaeia archaeon]|nr:hypothetical protein [Candidatus Bathyarchaeia archaeon]
MSGWIISKLLFARGSSTRGTILTLAFSCLTAGLAVPAQAQAPEGAIPAPATPPAQASKSAVFRVKYLGDGAVYIDAGRNADLQEGMKLSVVEAPPDGVIAEGIQYRGYPHVAELVVSSVSDSSAVCDVVESKGELKIGQAAFLTPESVQSRHQTELAAEQNDYPIVVTFSYGDPLDEEVRETKEAQVTRLTPMQRMQGRIGFNYGGTKESGGFTSRQMGLVIDADMRNIGGSYWNFVGSWRGNYGTSNANLPGVANQTLTDLVNRTYRIGFFYQSPYSPVTMGVGRLFIPWAPSLSTIDGGYFGRKITRKVTVGFFGGSTPDPSSWSYNQNQHIAGTLVNLEYGSFDHFRMYSTAGVALTSIQWKVARQFAFFENTWSWKQYVSFYNSLQADAARTSSASTTLPSGTVVTGGSNPTQVSQSFSSLHFQPLKWFGFGVNHNYFKTLPTFDTRLLGTGLLDQFLFQGFSGDVRFTLPKHIGLFASLGESKTTTDKKNSLNQAYGLSLGRLWKIGMLADLHYSKFNSTFGSGQYESFSLSKSFTDSFRVQVYGGHQIFHTILSSNTNSNFVNGVVDFNVGPRYFLEGNFGWYNGASLSYSQWSTVIGYRLGGFRK